MSAWNICTGCSAFTNRRSSGCRDTVDHSVNPREAASAAKRKEKLIKQLKECREYDEKMGAPCAQPYSARSGRRRQSELSQDADGCGRKVFTKCWQIQRTSCQRNKPRRTLWQSLNLQQIADRLNAEFTGDARKLVFWYDDKGAFAEDIGSLTLQKCQNLSPGAR